VVHKESEVEAEAEKGEHRYPSESVAVVKWFECVKEKVGKCSNGAVVAEVTWYGMSGEKMYQVVFLR